MEWRFLGSIDGGPGLELDHERFRYAGKFRMTSTGKSVVEEDGSILAAAAANRDRSDADAAWIRYVTVRDDRRGEAIGPRLLATTVRHLLGTVDRVRIAVNNPFSFEAAYKAGFGYTGEQTGIAELVLSTDAERSPATYGAGLAVFDARDGLSAAERGFLDRRASGDGVPPEPVEPPW